MSEAEWLEFKYDCENNKKDTLSRQSFGSSAKYPVKMLIFQNKSQYEEIKMPSDASWCDFEGIFLARPPFAFTGFFRGAEHLFQKSQNGHFLLFLPHFTLRWNPGVLRGFPEIPGLANRALLEVCRVFIALLLRIPIIDPG